MDLQALSIENVLQDDEVVGKVHPCILRLGFKYADGSLRGGNNRAIALISALRQLIQVQTDGCTPLSTCGSMRRLSFWCDGDLMPAATADLDVCGQVAACRASWHVNRSQALLRLIP